MEKQFVSVSDVWRKEVSIPDIVTAIETKGVYYFDRFGRYKKADPASCLNGLEFLWDWMHGGAGPVVDPETDEVLHDPSLQLDDYGWYEDEVPKFDRSDLQPKKMPQTQRTENILLKVIIALLESREVDWKTCPASKLVKLAELNGEQTWSDETARKYRKKMLGIVG